MRSPEKTAPAQPTTPDQNAIETYLLRSLPDDRYLAVVNSLLARPATTSATQASGSRGDRRSTLALTRTDTEYPLVDPFMLDLPTEMVNVDTYVPRKQVHQEISRQGSQIILGPSGSGKTTLVRALAKAQSDRDFRTAIGNIRPSARTLVVELPLEQIIGMLPERDLLEGNKSCLTPNDLARRIFDTFWRITLQEQERISIPELPLIRSYLDVLKRDLVWMRRLHWFYQHYPPTIQHWPDEFVLMDWLNSEQPSYFAHDMHTQGERALGALLDFVTDPAFERSQRYSAASAKIPWPVRRVQILVDGTEGLSNLALERLLLDAEKLASLSLGKLDFKLFVDNVYRDRVSRLGCVQEGRVALYELPVWTDDELDDLLWGRILGWTTGPESLFRSDQSQAAANRPEADRGPKRITWSELLQWISPPLLAPKEAYSKFVPTIIKGAQRAQELPNAAASAPAHCLRLARGLIAACAGGLRDSYQPPLGIEACNEIITAYWRAFESAPDA